MRRFLTVLVLIAAACNTTRAGRRYARDETAAALKRVEITGLELGEFPIDGANAVLDGDTIRVKGLQATLRLLGLDTEETFKHDAEIQAFNAGWEAYKKQVRGNSPRPVKFATPLGEDAKHWAQTFFEGIETVKIERDHPGEIRDFYGRYLAYLLVKKNGVWVNYNIECVRAGMSPYFVKYGRSRRFHKNFLEAEAFAKDARLGIWAPGKMHYDDYDERLKWWWSREASITRFEKQMADAPEKYVALTRWDALHRLEQNLGEEVTLLGAVSEIRLAETGPNVVKLGRSRGNDFDVVFFDKDVFLSSGLQFKKGEYVQVRGQVRKYKNRLQLVVLRPGQVLAPSEELQQALEPDEKKTATPEPISDEGD